MPSSVSSPSGFKARFPSIAEMNGAPYSSPGSPALSSGRGSPRGVSSPEPFAAPRASSPSPVFRDPFESDAEVLPSRSPALSRDPFWSDAEVLPSRSRAVPGGRISPLGTAFEVRFPTVGAAQVPAPQKGAVPEGPRSYNNPFRRSTNRSSTNPFAKARAGQAGTSATVTTTFTTQPSVFAPLPSHTTGAALFAPASHTTGAALFAPPAPHTTGAAPFAPPALPLAPAFVARPAAPAPPPAPTFSPPYVAPRPAPVSAVPSPAPVFPQNPWFPLQPVPTRPVMPSPLFPNGSRPQASAALSSAADLNTALAASESEAKDACYLAVAGLQQLGVNKAEDLRELLQHHPRHIVEAVLAALA